MATRFLHFHHHVPPVLSPRRRLCRRTIAVRSAARGGGGGAGLGPALVWFKHDLRIDDHPGLASAAANHRDVVPLYVFDPRILHGYSDTMLELLLFALNDLKMLLKSQKSDLLVRLGNAEDIILKSVNEVRASHVFAEEEVEHNVLSVIADVQSSLSAGPFSTENPPEIVFWRAPLYECQSLSEAPTSYDQFVKLKLPMATPLAAAELPPLKTTLDRGVLPTIEEVKKYLKEGTSSSKESYISCKDVSAESVLRRQSNIQGQVENKPITKATSAMGRRITKSMFASERAIEVRGGTNIVLDALAAYLRYLEGTGKDNWQELHEKVREAEIRSGASFYALFGPALCLGVISRRKVYREAIDYEKERNAGFLSPFGYSVFTVKAAIDAIYSIEWYWFLGLNCKEGNYPIKIWRWKGYLIQYTAIGNEGPAVLLVHGFGAFLEHFRDNMRSIADAGCVVWAITLLGFGKSEKPNVNYTELLWAELLRDFIVDVVGEPVHLVGNSIGGYIVAIVAGLWPNLAKSLVLLNTAGSIVPGYSSFPVNKEQSTSWLSGLPAHLLLLFLRSSAGNILKEYYPTKTERVDKSLISQMTRASYDPGAVAVIESIFNFNLSIPLNFLFDSFGGKVLVIQGMRDPLTKSKSSVSMIREHCNRVVIRELDAGHCPHDELPDQVNSLLCEWTKETEASTRLEKSRRT